MKQLIERLRTDPVFDDTTLGNEAADAIESLVKVNAQLADSILWQAGRISELTDEIAKMREPWQPIETAPKNGTLVLVREPRCSGLAVRFSGGWKYESGNICYLEPTQWMPIPGAQP